MKLYDLLSRSNSWKEGWYGMDENGFRDSSDPVRSLNPGKSCFHLPNCFFNISLKFNKSINGLILFKHFEFHGYYSLSD